LYVLAAGRARAYEPGSGALLWLQTLGSGSGALATGYGREVYAFLADSGEVKAIGDGWTLAPWYISVTPNVTGAITVEWSYFPAFPMNVAGAGPTLSGPASGTTSLSSGPNSYLLQRQTDGGEWEDLAIIPAGQTPDELITYADKTVKPGLTYAYRV
jgi:hypothetical protein